MFGMEPYNSTWGALREEKAMFTDFFLGGKKVQIFSSCQHSDTICAYYKRRSDMRIMNVRSTLLPALTCGFLLVPLGLS